ncbi:hypothetical protein ACM66B_000635 [Microbotryomycetes sp. NB124-2]
MAYLSEPQYVLAESARRILSETRPLQLASDALAAVNFTLDELLQLWVHVSLVSINDGNEAQTNVDLELYTTDRFKAGLLKVTGPVLGNQAVLEAEVTTQELIKLDSSLAHHERALKGSGATQTAPATPADTAHELFVSLREWVHTISELGAASSGSGAATIESHLQKLLPPTPPPPGTSSAVSYLTTVYAERSVTFVAEYLLRAIGRVAERGTTETASIVDVENAFAEDELVWALLQHMRVRTLIETEAAALRAKQVKPSPSMTHSRNGSIASISNGRQAVPSSPSSSTLGNVGGRERQSSFSSGLGIHGAPKSLADDFESLMLSGQTRKVSLTPDRLRTVEGLQSRPTSMRVAADPVAVANRNNRMSFAGPALRQDRPPVATREPSSDAQETLMDFVDKQPVPPGLAASPTGKQPQAARSSERLYGGTLMRPQPSQLSSNSGVSTGSEAEVDPNASPRISKPRIRPKDEREDLAHERQINHDLADFFATAEPPSSRNSSVSHSAFEILGPKDDPFQTSPKRSRGAFGGLFSRSRKKSNPALDNELERIESTVSRRVPPSVSGVSVRSRASSQDTSAMAAMRAAGFSDVAASRASYVPPPLLGLGTTEYLTPTDSVTPTAATFAEKPRTPTTSRPAAPSINALAQSDTSPVSLPRQLSNRGASSAPLPPSLGAEPSSSSARSASLRSHSSSYVSATRQASDRKSDARSASAKGSPLVQNSSRFDATTAAGVGVGAVASGAALATALGGSPSLIDPRSSNKSSSSPRVSSNGHPSPRFSGADDTQSASTAPSERQRKLHERTMSYSSTHSRSSTRGSIKTRPTSGLGTSGEGDSTLVNGLMPAADILPGPMSQLSSSASDPSAVAMTSNTTGSNKARLSLADADRVTVSLADVMALRVQMITRASSVADCVTLLENVFGLTATVAATEDTNNKVIAETEVETTSTRQSFSRHEASMAEFYLGGGDARMSRLYREEQRLSMVDANPPLPAESDAGGVRGAVDELDAASSKIQLEGEGEEQKEHVRMGEPVETAEPVVSLSM